MAEGIRREPVTRTVVEVVEKGGVTLNLTDEEAQALIAVVGRFEAGGPTAPIYYALKDAGVKTNFGDNRHYIIESRAVYDGDWKHPGTLRVTKQ